MKKKWALCFASSVAVFPVHATLVQSNAIQFGGVELAHLPGVVASQSSTGSGGDASRAIDGNYDNNYSSGLSTTHTLNAAGSYWQVDLGSSQSINNVVLFNRGDCCGDRLSNYSILVSDDPAFGSITGTSGNYLDAVPQGGIRSHSLGGAVGRYARVQLDGVGTSGEQILSLTEVEVVGGSSLLNFAALGSASQTSTLVNGNEPTAAKAIDGIRSGIFNNSSTTHTDGNSGNFWEVNLPELVNVKEVALFNREDCCQTRLSNFRITLFNGGSTVLSHEETGAGGALYSIADDTGFLGQADRVRVEFIGGLNNDGNGTLSLAEVEVWGVAAVPEPSTLAMVFAGLLGVVRLRRR